MAIKRYRRPPNVPVDSAEISDQHVFGLLVWLDASHFCASSHEEGRIDMTTSALSLSQVLAAISDGNRDQQKVTLAIAEHLGFDGEDAEVRAVEFIYLAVQRVKKDVSNLDLEQVSKDQLIKYVNNFAGITNLSHIYMKVLDAKNNFLKPDHINRLLDVHSALAQVARLPELPKEARDLAVEVRDIRSGFAESELPEHIKRVAIKRLGQIASILENAELFQPHELQEALEALIGSIVVQPPSKKSADYGLVGRVFKTAGTILTVLKGVDVGLGTTVTIIGNANALLEAVQPSEDAEAPTDEH